MKCLVKNIKVFGNLIGFETSQSNIQAVLDEQATAKYPIYCEIKQERPKRSLDANAYFWVLVGKIANVIGNTNDFVYEQAIKDYSKRYYMQIPKSDLGEKRQTYRFIEIIEETENSYKIFGWKGSSKFDTKSMAFLIDGIVYEAKDLDIETMTPAQLTAIKEDWRAKNGSRL
jgi:hypothetical protein